jgi:tRNA-2-methylthio-N6-dimethylallyladenosine synthase
MSLTRFQSKSRPAAPEAEGAPKLHVVTFGCQMNKYDSLLVEGRFQRRGWSTSARLEDADLVLFNTCSVRDHAEERVYSWLGELKRAKARRPELVIGVMGCMAQRVGAEVFGRAAHVDIVCGTRRLQHLPELVDELLARRRERADARVLATETDAAVAVERDGEPYTGGLHGYLTVMRGCDLNCTFCIVPSVRGRVQSRPIADLVREARWMVGQGCRAITLLGQTVNSYGEDAPAPRRGAARGRGRQGRPALADLLYELQALPELLRIRLVTLHPAYVTQELARALAECSKCERFLPLPAQHGSDAVLRAMKRGYTTELYRQRTELLRSEVPDIELGSDWIVGFPGESEEQYSTCEAFLTEQGFAVNYVFQYSARPGTRAAELVDDVPARIKAERNQRLLRVAERAQAARLAAHVGLERRVLVERVCDKDPALVRGRTEHGLPAAFAGPAELVGSEVAVAIEEASAYGLAGRALALAE